MSNSGLISTVAFKLAGGPTFFGLEGSVGCAVQALDWLNVGMGIAREEVVDLQKDEEEDGCGGVVIVPAYGGLLCPRWRPDAGGVILGLGLHTRPRHLSQGHHGEGGAHAQGGLGMHEH